MEAYKPYVDYILAGGVAETAYILSKEGAICATNLPIQSLPQYNFELEDDKDPNKKHQIVVDERVNLLEAIANQGVAKHKEGIRLYNQKYYTVRYEPAGSKNFDSLYLKKVNCFITIVKRRSMHLCYKEFHLDRNIQHWNEDAKWSCSKSRRIEQES